MAKKTVFGLIAAAAVAGLALAGCEANNPGGTADGKLPSALIGKWEYQYTRVSVMGQPDQQFQQRTNAGFQFTTDTYTEYANGTTTGGGTASVQDSLIWFGPPGAHGKPYAVSGNTLVIDSDVHDKVARFSWEPAGGGGGNSLTITGITGGTQTGGMWSVTAITSDPASYSAAGTDIVNAPGMGIVSSGETAVAWATEPPSGTYTIIMTAGTEMKKKAGVSIPGTAAFNAFSDFPYY